MVEAISLSRKDTATGRQSVNVKTTDDARAVLDEWDKTPIEPQSGAKKGTRRRARSAKKTTKTASKRKH